METVFWILGFITLVVVALVWLANASWDSSYDQMVKRMNEDADEPDRNTTVEENKDKDLTEKTLRTPQGNTSDNSKYTLINHPTYGTVTWSGRGRKPKWLVEYLANGGSLEEIEK